MGRGENGWMAELKELGALLVSLASVIPSHCKIECLMLGNIT